MPEHGGDDHGMHTTAAQLGGDGVAHAVQPRCRVQPGFAGEAFERAGERIWIDEEPVAAVADEGSGSAELVERVTPSRAERRAPLQLLPAVQPDPLHGEGGS